MNYPLRSGGGSHNIVTDYEYDALNRLDWQVNFVDLAELKTELKGMRVNSTGMERATARARGEHCGNGAWRRKVARRLQLEHTLRARGRPRKQSNSTTAAKQ